MYPLVVDGYAIGVMEVIAPSEMLEERRDTIDAVVGQSANVFRSMVDVQERATAVRSMSIMLGLAGDLLRAETASSAVGSTVQRCFEQFGTPIAGLLPDRSGSGWFVAAAGGIGAKRRVMLRRCTEEISALGRSRATRDRLAERFAGVVGRDHAEAIDAGSAVLLVVDVLPARREALDTGELFLPESLDRIGTVDWAQARNESLDLAIACTAHELKAPLVGARAALDHVSVSDEDPSGQVLLRRSRDELGLLADLVDPLLRWSAGESSLNMDRTDLVEVVRDTVEHCSTEEPDPVVTLESPPHAWVNCGRPTTGARHRERGSQRGRLRTTIPPPSRSPSRKPTTTPACACATMGQGSRPPNDT